MVVANLPSGSLAWGTLKRSSTSRMVAEMTLISVMRSLMLPRRSWPERSLSGLALLGGHLLGGVAATRRALGLEDETREQPGELGGFEVLEDARRDRFGDQQIALVVDRAQGVDPGELRRQPSA